MWTERYHRRDRTYRAPLTGWPLLSLGRLLVALSLTAFPLITRAQPGHAADRPQPLLLGQPTTATVASALNLAAENALPSGYPALVEGVPAVPTVLLKAIAWVESRWRQFDGTDRPLVSGGGSHAGYGVMQVTDGLGGQSVTPEEQSAIVNNFVYNIASGARLLTEKWLATPAIGPRDATVLEDWYYAVWAYNTWGWRNNPNNPIFKRSGTPLSNPRGFPYQERVFYALSHPPLDASGHPLWAAVAVTLPSSTAVGRTPRALPAPLVVHYDTAPNDGPLPLSPVDREQFGRDLSLPDGTVVAPGAHLRKLWLVRNSGDVFWTGYRWRHVAGDLLGADASTPVAFTPPLADVTIGVDLIAPLRPGAYKGYWQLFDPKGHAIGSAAWVAITVVATPTASTGSAIVPTVVAATTASPIAVSTSVALRIPVQSALDNAAYVADSTTPQLTTLRPGQVFTKTWEMQNTGTRPWDSRFHWVFQAGAPLGTIHSVAVPGVAVGDTVNFYVRMVAPYRPGSYRSYWQMTDPTGLVFGAQAQVALTVAAPVVATATSPPTPSATAVPTATATVHSQPAPTVRPTVTATARPGLTATPRPTTTPQPTATPPPQPTATARPQPTATPRPLDQSPATPVPWFGPPVTRSFFAEGYTGDGFHEYLSLLNPQPYPLSAHLTIYRTDGAVRTLAVRLDASTRRSIDLNLLAPRSSTALTVVADGEVVAERGVFTRNGHVVAGAPLPGRHWYIAEGYVGDGFRESLRIFNPYDPAASVTIRAYRSDGSVLLSHRLVGGGARLNVLLDDIAPIGASGLEVDSSSPTVVEEVVDRRSAAGPSAALALADLSRHWYFPDGGTTTGNQEYIVLLNPGTRPATVHLTPVTGHGYQGPITLHVGAQSRAVYVMQGLIRSGGLAADLSSDQPIAAQEVRYSSAGGVTVVNGAPAPAHLWGLAEGHTGDGFKEWIVLFNNGEHTATVSVRLLTGSGVVRTLTLRERPHRRDYLYLNDLVRSGPVSALISADHPIVVGRTMIFNRGEGLSTTVGQPLRG